MLSIRIINKQPALFEKSHHTIWTDPHIQQQILKKVAFREISIHKKLLGENNFTSNGEIFIVAKK